MADEPVKLRSLPRPSRIQAAYEVEAHFLPATNDQTVVGVEAVVSLAGCPQFVAVESLPADQVRYLVCPDDVLVMVAERTMAAFADVLAARL